MLTYCFTKQKRDFVSNNIIDYNSLDNIKSYLIAIFSQSFQQIIEKLAKDAHNLQNNAKDLYKEAEIDLLTELDLLNFKPKHTLTFVNISALIYLMNINTCIYKKMIFFYLKMEIGIAYCIQEKKDFLVSGAILILRVIKNNIDPLLLSLVLNSSIVQSQAEKDSGGSIINHWLVSSIENVIIPNIPQELQEKIASKVQKSFKYREQAKSNLDLAKKLLELAIETSENKARDYYNFLNY